MFSLRPVRVAALTVGLVAVATGCTGSGPADTDKPSPATGSAAAATLRPPDVRPGYKEIASGGPRRGDWDLGPVRLVEGVSWVNVNCLSDTGTGKLTLTIDTVGSFTVDCPSDEARINVNQLDLAEGRKGRLHIETADRVRWIASIQVPS